MNLFGAGLYWRLDGGPLQAAVRGGVGYAFFDGDRRLESPTLSLRADSKWNAWMVDAYAGVSYELRMGGFYARPELSASYLRLAEDGYKEKNGGAGFNLIVDKRTGDLADRGGPAGPGVEVRRRDLLGARDQGGLPRQAGRRPGQHDGPFRGRRRLHPGPGGRLQGGAVVRAGFRGGAARVVYAVNGGATVDKDYKEYDVRATVRFQF